MSRVCRITPRASQDIEEIADYLAIDSGLDRAETFLSGIFGTPADCPISSNWPQAG